MPTARGRKPLSAYECKFHSGGLERVRAKNLEGIELKRTPLHPSFVFQWLAAERAQLRRSDKQSLALVKFWESMADFPDLNVVHEALYDRCEGLARGPDPLLLPVLKMPDAD